MNSERPPLRVGWKVASLSPQVASIRYRALLPLLALEDEGVVNRLFRAAVEDDLEHLDVLVIVKSFTPDDLLLAQAASRRGVRVVFDLCDNIFLDSYSGKAATAPAQMLLAMQPSLDSIVVTTDPLAEVVREQLPGLPVFVIPDGIETTPLLRRMSERLRAAQAFEDGQRLRMLRRKVRNVLLRVRQEGIGLVPLLFAHVTRRALRWGRQAARRRTRGGHRAQPKKLAATPARSSTAAVSSAPASEHGQWPPTGKVILWFGNHGAPHARFGMLDLLEIRGALEAAGREFDAELVVISNNEDKYEQYIQPLAIRSRYVEWSNKAVDQWLEHASVVVIPNSLDAFSICKSANRSVLATTRGVPVVATPTPALEALREHLHLGDPLEGLRRYLADPLEGRESARRAAKLAQSLYGQQAIADAWLEVLQRSDATEGRAGEAPVQCVVALHLIQDLDLAMPVLRALMRAGLTVETWCSAALMGKSPRVLATLRRESIPFRVLPAELNSSTVRYPATTRLLVTMSETNLGPHRFTRRLTEVARRRGIHAATLQHGFENVGLTYDDAVHGIERISILADRIYTWSPIEHLHPRVSDSVRSRCLPVGCPKPAVTAPAPLGDLLPAGQPIIGVFENLHWHRYDDTYRAEFLEAVHRLAIRFPGVCFLVKPHHAGQWMTHRHEGNRPEAPNLKIADPQAPAWEAFTATDLLGHLTAVITTPSTVALDAARQHLPVAVVAGQLDVPRYEPLPLLRDVADWERFVAGALDAAERDQWTAMARAFVDRVLVPGDAAERIAVDLASRIIPTDCTATTL